jgi:hypothetical protein
MQSYSGGGHHNSHEYANSMQQLTENLVVKVGRQMPIEKKIQGEIIKQWRIYTLKYF